MKNWGTRILILYLGFVALIATLVTLSMRQKTDLVAKDYYAQEIAYQDKLDKMNRAQQLGEPVQWKLQGNSLLFEFPKGSQLPLKGTMNLFCPSDAANDRSIAFETSGYTCEVQLPVMATGRYMLQIDWQAGTQTYYQEGALKLP